jgi:rubrerythrin
MDAFAGESQANQKYRAFAKMAEKEGFAKKNRGRIYFLKASYPYNSPFC